jgi:hypothetical protein
MKREYSPFAMTAVGQQRLSTALRTRSALPSVAEVRAALRDFAFVPLAEVAAQSKSSGWPAVWQRVPSERQALDNRRTA